MFSKFRAFLISGFNSSTGAPTISTATPLLSVTSGEQEINNISIDLTPRVTSRTWKADNKEDVDQVKTGYDGNVTFYGIDKTAIATLTNNIVDSQGNTVLGSTSEGNPKVVLFYHGKNAKGKKYNIWLYNVEFGEIPFKSGQEEDNPETLSLSFTANSITYKPANGTAHTVQGIVVWEGSTGYIDEGTDPTAAGLVLPVYQAPSSQQ